MARLDIAKARQAGLSDQQIQEYAQRRGVSVYDSSAQQEQGGGLTNLLPMLGAIGGSFTPFGPIAGGAGGAALGTLAKQLIQQKQPDVGEIGKEAALGGVGGVIGKGIGSIAGKVFPRVAGAVGKGTGQLGESLIASQYNVPRNVATRIGFPGSVRTLADYGITSIKKVPEVAEKVTGATGIISKITRSAVGKANPVELSAFADRPSVLEVASNLAGDPSLPIGQDSKFVAYIQKGIQSVLGGSKGSITGQADPSDVFGFIQKLERESASVGGGKARHLLSESEHALKKAYQGVADELRERLFTTSGADQQLISAMTPQQLQELATISPKLAQDVASAKTVGELRHVAAPFVQANQAAKTTEAASRYAFADFGGQGKGLGKLVPSLSDPLAIGRAALSSAPVNAFAGKALLGASRGIPFPAGVGKFGAQALGQGTARSAFSSGTLSPISEGGLLPPREERTAPSPETNDLNRLFASLILKNPKQATALTAAYKLLAPQAGKPLTGQQQKDKKNAESGLRAIAKVQEELRKQPLSPVLSKIPIVSGRSPYRAASKEVADVYTRLRTGAALNKQEIQFYDQQLPQPFDSTEVVQYKLKIFKDLFTEFAFRQQGALQESSIPYPEGYEGL